MTKNIRFPEVSMRQAIVTRFLGPTDYRGARVKASADAGSVTLSWDDSLDVADNHRAAALALVAKLEWSGEWIGGSMPVTSSHAYCFVQVM